jgi:curved DNA-binding protein CbpA
MDEGSEVPAGTVPFTDGAPDDHYGALGLPPRASREQIERAYRFCREIYGAGSLATYSLLEPHEVEATRGRIDVAYQVLTDPALRRAYDEGLGLAPCEANHSSFASTGPEPGSEPMALPDVITGAELRRQREMRAISLRQIANASKIGVRYLQYIEEDRFQYLPAPVYLRGFLSEYARVVGLDAHRVAESYIARLTRKG